MTDLSNEHAYIIVDTTDVDRITAKLEKSGMNKAEIFQFKLDMVAFVNFLETNLNKELSQADEFDLKKFGEYAKTDPTLGVLAERRLNNARTGLEILRQF